MNDGFRVMNDDFLRKQKRENDTSSIFPFPNLFEINRGFSF